MPWYANRSVVLIAAAVMGAAAAGRAQQAPPRFVAGTDAILVDALVTRDGQPVEGLTAADFVVKDSGVTQTAQLVAVASLPVNLLLAFDTSASVRGASLDHLKSAAKATIGGLRPGDEAALLTFSHNVLRRSGWSASRDGILAAIDGVSAQGPTALNDAAFASLAMASRPGARTLILFFTDGDDTVSWLSAADVLQAARRTDAVVYAVTLESPGHSGAIIGQVLADRQRSGNRARESLQDRLAAEPSLYRGALLPLLALETGGETMKSADTATLGAAFAQILSRFNRRYVLAYTPAGVPAGGWHPIDVEVRGGGDVTARRGYTR